MKNTLPALFFLMGLLQTTHTLAQPVIKQQKAIGGSLTDQFSCMAHTRDGGLIAGGFSDSKISGDKTENPRYRTDYWVVKLDALGGIQWDKTVGGNLDDRLTDVKQTSDGGYILGGWTSSGMLYDKTETSRGFNDYWIVKLDSLGNIQWDKTIGGNKYDYFSALQQTLDGGYILAGYSNSDMSGEKSQGTSEYYAGWVVKVDNAGQKQWDKNIWGMTNLFAVQLTSDGGYIFGGDSSGNSADQDYEVTKTDSLGNIQWSKTYGGTSSEFLTALEKTSDHGYIISGYSNSPIRRDKTEGSKGGYDYWVVKVDSLGTIQWDKTVGGNDNDFYPAVKQTVGGGYILAGYSPSNISGDKTENSRGLDDYWVVKLSATGKVQWDKTIGGSNSDGLQVGGISVMEILPNKFIVGGSSMSGISGDKTEALKSSDGITADFWLVGLVFNKPAAIANNTRAADNIKMIKDKSIMAYPNPAKDLLHVQNATEAVFTLTNKSGKIVAVKTINGEGDICISNLPAGLYYLRNSLTGLTQNVVVIK